MYIKKKNVIIFTPEINKTNKTTNCNFTITFLFYLTNTNIPHSIIPHLNHLKSIEQFLQSSLPITLPAKPTSPKEVLYKIKKIANNKFSGYDFIHTKYLKIYL